LELQAQPADLDEPALTESRHHFLAIRRNHPIMQCNHDRILTVTLRQRLSESDASLIE
jgi:hypothetical protein